MARKPIYHEEKKAQIVQAALTTFSKHGYDGTTNKLIAQETGRLSEMEGKPISPALIYHYFPQGKTELFAACLDQFPPFQQFADSIQASLGEPPEAFLRIVVRNYDTIFSNEGVLPIVRLIVSEGPRHPELIGILLGRITPILVPLASYFEKLKQIGVISNLKTDQIVLPLLGPIFVRRVIMASIGRESFPIPISTDEDFLESLVQTLLRGVFNR